MRSFERILISAAMDSEILDLMEELDDPERLEVAGYTLVLGKIDEKDVAVLKTEIGMVNGTASVAFASDYFKPDLIINLGTAGAHNPQLHVGDVVVASSTASINNQFGDDQEIYTDPLLSSRAAAHFNRILSSRYECEKLGIPCPMTEYGSGKSMLGCIGSGDVWNKDKDVIDGIREEFGTDAEDMETYAAAHVASRLGIPFLGFRIMSNSEVLGEAYKPETGSYCQSLCLSLLENIDTIL